MDFRDPKRNLNFLGKMGDTESDGAKDNKRPRTDDNEDHEVEEFFALVDRIQAMGKFFKPKQLNSSSAEERSRAETLGANVIKQQSPWSFEWEDFSILPRENNHSSQMHLCSCTDKNASSSGLSLKADSGNHKYKPVERFDLNEEATWEEPVPAD